MGNSKEKDGQIETTFTCPVELEENNCQVKWIFNSEINKKGKISGNTITFKDYVVQEPYEMICQAYNDQGYSKKLAAANSEIKMTEPEGNTLLYAIIAIIGLVILVVGYKKFSGKKD